MKVIIMSKSISKEQYKEIYDMLNRVEVLDRDCGQLCNAACCTVSFKTGDEDMGIYLLPGEEAIHLDDDWMDITVTNAQEHDLPGSWDGEVYFGRCKTPPVCPRDMRPIQCRTFPLAPHLDEEGELTMVYNDLELPYVCPLIEEEIPLEDDYVEMTLKVWEMLIEDPKIYDLVRMDSEAREDALEELIDKLGF